MGLPLSRLRRLPRAARSTLPGYPVYSACTCLVPFPLFVVPSLEGRAWQVGDQEERMRKACTRLTHTSSHPFDCCLLFRYWFAQECTVIPGPKGDCVPLGKPARNESLRRIIASLPASAGVAPLVNASHVSVETPLMMSPGNDKAVVSTLTFKRLLCDGARVNELLCALCVAITVRRCA